MSLPLPGQVARRLRESRGSRRLLMQRGCPSAKRKLECLEEACRALSCKSLHHEHWVSPLVQG